MINSFAEMMKKLESEFGSRLAFQWYDGEKNAVESKTYGAFVADVKRFVRYLNWNDSQMSGKHVAILAQSSYHFAVAVYGIVCCGAVVVPLNNREREEVIQDELKQADIEAVVTDACVRKDLLGDFCGNRLEITGYQQETDNIELQYTTDIHDLALLLFTSGTTGKNKCVAITCENLFYLMRNGFDILEAYAEAYSIKIEKFFHMLPLYHAFGIQHIFTFPSAGMTINLCNDVHYIYRDLKLMPSDITAVVPMVLTSWHKDVRNGHIDRLCGLKLLVCGGAAIDPDYFKLFVENGINIALGYAMTENMGHAAMHLFPASQKFGSIGRAMPGCELKIDDGEICSKCGSVMKGYYKDPEETAKVLQYGWLHTGDLGYMDEDGYVYLTGRKKNLIILSSGENVSPEELEALVMKNTDVKEILVKEKEGRICAEIFCDADKQGSVRAYVTEVNRTLPMYKRMTRVEFRDEPFPKTATGKIQRV